MQKTGGQTNKLQQQLQEQPSAEPPRRSDALVISSDARRQLAELADSARDLVSRMDLDNDGSDEIREDKIQLARARIKSGYYDLPEIKKQIADRLADDLSGPLSENE